MGKSSFFLLVFFSFIALAAVFPEFAIALGGGGGSGLFGDNEVNNVVDFLTGDFAKLVGLVGIVIAGVMLAMGENSAFRTAVMILGGVAFILGAWAVINAIV